MVQHDLIQHDLIQHEVVQHEDAPPQIENYHAIAMESSSTQFLFSDSFERGTIRYSDPAREFFAWSRSGNQRWKVAQVTPNGSFDGGTRIATVGGRGEFAAEGNLILTVGGNTENEDDETADLREAMEEKGACVTFGIRTSLEFPIDSLVFRVNEDILGYWKEATSGWERVTAFLPPGSSNDAARDGAYRLSWTYGYDGGDGNDDREDTVQLDALTVEATTGDLTVDDDELENLRHDTVPALTLGGWYVSDDDDAHDGRLSLKATTRQVIRDANPNGSLDTYHGAASMSLVIVAGEFGGTLSFAVHSNANAPLEVLEVGVDGRATTAITGPSAGWETRELELEAGRRVVTFVHVSNPEHLPIATLEGMGEPGWSKVREQVSRSFDRVRRRSGVLPCFSARAGWGLPVFHRAGCTRCFLPISPRAPLAETAVSLETRPGVCILANNRQMGRRRLELRPL